MSSEPDVLLGLLKWRFARVVYQAEQDRYEIDGLVLLSAAEARLVIDGDASLEDIVIYRTLASHLLPEHIRRALCRTEPLS